MKTRLSRRRGPGSNELLILKSHSRGRRNRVLICCLLALILSISVWPVSAEDEDDVRSDFQISPLAPSPEVETVPASKIAFLFSPEYC